MDEAVVKRILPHSTEAEQSVIGSMLMDKDAIQTASEILTADDFYSKQYGILFQTMVELNDIGKPVDLVTLRNALIEKDVPAEISSLEYVRELLMVVPSSMNVKYYADIVYDKAVLRRMIRVNEEIANECYQQTESADDILDESERKIFEITGKRTAGDFVPISQVVVETLKKINVAAQNKGNVTGVPTGFTDLDYQTAGFQPSDLILIAARPSMGKTAFVLNVAENICFEQGKSAAIFSLEMSREQLVNRLLSVKSHVDSQHIRTGNMNSKEWEGIVEAARIIGGSQMIIDDTPGISIGELRSKCRKYKKEMDISIVIIDYLQLMTGSGHSESRQNEISEISRSLKALARELKVPVVALSQLSRAVEKRDDHRPMLSDLRESGAIEQDADVVMFLYRDDYYHKESEKKGIAEVIVAKQRNGPIGTIELIWLPDNTRFANKSKS